MLTATGGAVLLATTACQPFSSGTKITTTVTAPAPAIADPIVGLIAVTRLHLLRIQSWAPALSADPTNQALLGVLAKDRQAHLTALLTEQKRTNSAAANTAAGSGTVPAPDDVKLVIPTIRTDAADAQQQLTDALALVSRYRAALFASMAACLATHRAVLS